MKKLLILFILFFSFSVICSQVNNKIHLVFNKKYLHIRYSPFSEVEVLDNRFDTSKIYTNQSGGYPPLTTGFDTVSNQAMKKYLNTILKSIPHGNKKLLINIAQLRITNKTWIVNTHWNQRLYFPFIKGKKKLITGHYRLRDYILFSAQSYTKDGDGYKKILEVKYNFYRYKFGDLNKLIAAIFAELLEASCFNNDFSNDSIADNKKALKYFLDDSLWRRNKENETRFTLDEINRNATDIWKSYSIFKSSNYSNGVFAKFDDFKNDSCIPTELRLSFDGNDSLFKIDILDSNNIKNKYHWAVRCDTNLYLWIYKNSYLKLQMDSNTFWFNVPHTLPDMYAMLSLEESNATSNSSSVNSGNLVADLIGIFITSAVETAIKSAQQKKIKKEGLKNNFRNCFIDMDTGDIIY